MSMSKAKLSQCTDTPYAVNDNEGPGQYHPGERTGCRLEDLHPLTPVLGPREVAEGSLFIQQNICEAPTLFHVS